MLRCHDARALSFRSIHFTRRFTSDLFIGLTCTLSVSLYTAAAIAQSPGHSLTQLKEMTVSASRGERRVDEVPASVTLITAETIEREGARDLKEIFRHELDVTVPSGPTRFSNAGTS
jgi:hemoglobin/transferrin/lactoferrin receptor protein